MSVSESLANVAIEPSSSAGCVDQLPFYKRPRPNAYQFVPNDFASIPVVQHRFKPRPPYVPPPTPPTTTEQVTDGGQAQQAGIQLGDSIVRINDADTDNMSLAEAQKRIEAEGADGDLKLAVKKFDEGAADEDGRQQEVSLGRRPQAQLNADRGRFTHQRLCVCWFVSSCL